MRLQTIFQPRVLLSRDEVGRGLRALTWEGVASTGFSSVTTSTFLVAFALALGANNFQIGVLASLPFITDVLQIPAVWLVEKLRRRKAMVFIPWLISQLFWIPIALIPIFMDIPGNGAVAVLLGLMAVRGILNALANCGWSSWMRDLVPQNILGRYFARRESLATALAVILGLSAGYFIDQWNSGGGGVMGYSYVLLIGLVFFGLVSPAMMAVIPEPMMPPVAGARPSFSRTITAPLREPNYRHFMKYLMFWGFASNLAIPFLAVFMLQQLKLSIFTVILLTTISEIFVVIPVRFWGPLADRFGSKTVLYLSSFLFLLVLMGWTVTAIPGYHTHLLPLLALLHILIGIAVAGITLTAGTLSFKLAPHGRATPYLAGASLADSAGTGIGALAGGYLADLLAGRTLALDLSWARPFKLDSIHLTGYHLLFGLAFVFGLITLRTLQAVHETGATRKEAVWPALVEHIGPRFHRFITAPHSPFFQAFQSGYLRRLPGTVEAIVVTINCCDKTEREAAPTEPATLLKLEKKPPSRMLEMVVLPACW